MAKCEGRFGEVRCREDFPGGHFFKYFAIRLSKSAYGVLLDKSSSTLTVTFIPSQTPARARASERRPVTTAFELERRFELWNRLEPSLRRFDRPTHLRDRGSSARGRSASLLAVRRLWALECRILDTLGA